MEPRNDLDIPVTLADGSATDGNAEATASDATTVDEPSTQGCSDSV